MAVLWLFPNSSIIILVSVTLFALKLQFHHVGICRNDESRQAAKVASCNHLLLLLYFLLLIITPLQPAVLFHVSGNIHLQMTMTGSKVWYNGISLSTVKTIR